jgi:hypothetical protein
MPQLQAMVKPELWLSLIDQATVPVNLHAQDRIKIGRNQHQAYRLVEQAFQLAYPPESFRRRENPGWPDRQVNIAVIVNLAGGLRAKQNAQPNRLLLAPLPQPICDFF